MFLWAAQLKTIKEAEARMRAATARVQELEESRMAAEDERLTVTRDMDSMRASP
jgi:hypothetical protein